MEAKISTRLTKVKTNVSRAFEEQQCPLNMPSGVQPMSNGFIITAWWIKALRALPAHSEQITSEQAVIQAH